MNSSEVEGKRFMVFKYKSEKCVIELHATTFWKVFSAIHLLQTRTFTSIKEACCCHHHVLS